MYTILLNGIVATYYTNHINMKIMIVAMWMPDITSNKKLIYEESLLDAGYDIIVPEYYGFCRSSWTFTPEHCVQTIRDVKKYCHGGVYTDMFTQQHGTLSYNIIDIVGTSFGGAIVCVLPKFDTSITRIGLICPVLDYIWLWKYGWDQTVDDVKRLMQNGFQHLYRGFSWVEFDRYFAHTDAFHPLAAIQYLKWKNIFIAHGKKDSCIDYRHTLSYIQQANTTITSYIPNEENHSSIKKSGIEQYCIFLDNLA
jgi:pimeloyl-ACP methyl ester carboxylesterase